MDTAPFFKKILPAAGIKLLAELTPYRDKQTGEIKEGWRYTKFDNTTAMAIAVAQFEEQGRTVYHACNSFNDWYEDPATGKKRIRTQANVTACRSLYDDIDCGEEKAVEGKGYPTKKDAFVALKGFIEKTSLPMPMIVDSGNGLHLYWPMTEDISPEEWKYLSGLKRRLSVHVGLIADRACDMDLSRVLRPVGSTNKKYGNTKTVTLKYDCDPVDPAKLRELLEAAVESLNAPMVPMGNAKPKMQNAFGAALERDYPDSFADIVAEHCATIRWFKETGAPDEPLWHKCVGALKYCVDGEEKIHEWSSRYENYDASETSDKIAFWTFGPASCEVIKSCSGNKCADCELKCSYPIQLGHKETAEAPNISEIKESPQVEVEINKDELVKSLWGPKVRKEGKELQYSTTDQDTGLVKWTTFSKSIFYPTDLIKNEEGEWEVVIEYFTRYNKRRQFQMPTSYIASSDKLAGVLAAHTIFLQGKNGRAFAMEHLKDIIIGLQEHRQEVVTEEAFGWSQDGSEFIIGTTVITEDGKTKTALLSEHIRNGGLGRDFGMEGTRDEWVRLVNEIYNRPGAEPYQFAFLVAAASPLIQMAGIDQFHGIPVAYTGAGGRGKTTACRLACSMWGKGENFLRSSNKDGSTINGLLAMTAIYKNLPLIMDEMTGQKIEDISQMLYALSNGQSKIRLNSSGTFANKLLRWDLFSFVTGNMDITGLLANLDRQQAEAVSVRCFEIKVPDDLNETVFKDVDVKRLIDVEMARNYGVVGRELIRVYMKNRGKIIDYIHRLRQEHQPKTADESRERFYIDLICFALAAGKVMASRGIIRFDLDAIKRWAFNNIKLLRTNRIDRRYTEHDIIGDFISSLHDNTIVTKHIADMRRAGAPEVPLEMLRGEPLARKATVDRKFYVAAKAISVWCKTNNVSASALREMLDRQGYIVRAVGRGDETGGFNFRLGQGTTRTTGLARCYELDFDKVHGLAKEGTDGNVVPINAAKAPAPDETVLDEAEKIA